MKKPTIQINMIPAAHGDAFLIRFSSDETTPVNMLIDGGLVSTYRKHLRKKLIALREQGEQLDLVVVTHIDGDHIGGILALLKENGSFSESKVIKIGEVWHNSYRHLPLNGRAATESEITKVLAQVVKQSTSEPDSNISVRQGESLSEILVCGGYNWNTSFDKLAICVGKKTKLQNGATIEILSPNTIGLKQLTLFWQRELIRMGIDQNAVIADEFEGAFEGKAAQEVVSEILSEKNISDSEQPQPPPIDSFKEDISTTNCSSIAFLLEWQGIKCLFLGDAWPSVVQQSLRSGETFDVVKISHHGARGNTSPELLSHLTSRHFLCSSDGSRHNHPNLDTLLWIVSIQPKPLTLHFNHPTKAVKLMSETQIKDHWGYNIELPKNLEDGLFLVLTNHE